MALVAVREPSYLTVNTPPPILIASVVPASYKSARVMVIPLDAFPPY
nr:MAG TPA: hypothetical protein [Bacteriophage sp.]